MLSLFVSNNIATRTVVLGSRRGNWVYGYIQFFNIRSLEIWVVVTALSGALLAGSWMYIRKTNERPPTRLHVEWLLIVVWCAGGLVLQALIRRLTPFTFGNIFASDAANSFYSVALRYDASTILREFDSLRKSWPLHAQSNLPGKLLLVRALIHISTRPDILAWVVVAISNFGGSLLYVFVRDLFGDRRLAFFSLALYLFLPAKLFFFPLLNTVTPVVIFGCLCLLQRWLATRRPAYAALLGVAVYILALFEPMGLVIGVLCAALVARAVARRDIGWQMVLLHGGVGVAAFAAAYGVMFLTLGFDLLSASRMVAADAATFNLEAARPYEIWVRQNLFDFLFGVGICQVVVFGPALADGLAGAPLNRLSEPIAVLCIALLGTLAVSDLIGVNRGEVIRLWIFLACLFQIPTAYVCARLNSVPAMALVLATTILQDVLGTSMIGFIVPQ